MEEDRPENSIFPPLIVKPRRARCRAPHGSLKQTISMPFRNRVALFLGHNLALGRSGTS